MRSSKRAPAVGGARSPQIVSETPPLTPGPAAPLPTQPHTLTCMCARRVCIALGCFGFGTSYLIVMGGLCPQISQWCGASGVLLSRQFWISLLGFGLELPLMFLPSLDSLRFSSLVGNVGAALIVRDCVLDTSSILCAHPFPTACVSAPKTCLLAASPCAGPLHHLLCAWCAASTARAYAGRLHATHDLAALHIGGRHV